MSLTSYRAAPPRVTMCAAYMAACSRKSKRLRASGGVVAPLRGFDCEWVLWVFPCSPAAMPGDDLLFHRLGDSTIGAVGFHVRVRDGIGWDTDAMATRQ